MKKQKNLFLLLITVIAIIIFSNGCSNSSSKSSIGLLLAGGTTQEFPGQVLNSDTTITTSLGQVQGSAIVHIPFGTTVENLMSAISAAQGATFNVFEEDGITPASILTASCVIGVSAEDGTQATYTLGILPDPAILKEWIGFEPGFPEYTIVNAQIADGYGDNPAALSFDGDPATLDYISSPDIDALTLRNSGTIEVLVKADSFFPYAGIVHKGELSDFSDEAWGLQLWDYAGSPARLLFMITGDDGNWIGIHGSYDLLPGTWYHIVGTWDNAHLRLYVNGVLDGEIANTTGGVRDTNGGLIIGAQLSQMYSGSYGNLGWDGIIDRVIIRSDTVSNEWVLSRYNSL
jgi:hypothetical protein